MYFNAALGFFHFEAFYFFLHILCLLLLLWNLRVLFTLA